MPISGDRLAAIIADYDQNLARLENKALERVNGALEASYKRLEAKLLKSYSQNQGLSLLAKQRSLLILNDVADVLSLVNTKNAPQIQTDFENLLRGADEQGTTMAQDLASAIADADLQKTTGLPLDAVSFAAQNAVKRLSKHDQEFQEKAATVVTQGLIMNWGTQKTARLLRGELGLTKSKAEMIVRTETLAASNEAAQASFKESGIKHFLFQATADDRLCPYCSARNQKVFKLGESVPPIHPRCRCFSVPWMKEWVKDELIDTAWSQKFRDDGIAGLKAQGKEPNNGLSPFEKAAGAAAPPKPIWEPGQVVKTRVKPAPKPQPVAETVPDFPDTIDGLKTVRQLGGSTGATLVQDPATGKQYVLKRGASPDHLREEMFADAAYQALGVPVPNFKGYETKDGPVKLAEFIEGKSLKDALKGKPEDVAKLKQQIQQHFAADTLLGNWDVAGMESDNILVTKDGTAYRIDNGGSLRYRAQGGLKGDRWNKYPTELWSLRNADVNEQTAEVFGGLSHTDLVKQMEALQGQKAALLKALPKELHSTIEGRLGQMQHLSKVSRTLLDDQWTDDYTSRFARHTLGLRADGIVDRLPKELTQTHPRSVTVVDENGDKFDSLRGKGSIVADMSRYMGEAGGNHRVIYEWMASQASNSWNDAPKAFKYLLVNQRNLPPDRYFWRDGVDASRNAYRDAVQSYGEKAYQESFVMWHAFTHEMILKTNFSRKNQDGSVTLIRTEDPDVVQGLYGLKPGDRDKVIARGPAESTSVYQEVEAFGTEVTIQNVPAHRIFGTYWTERRAEQGGTAFMGDDENEFVALMEDIPFDYLGEMERLSVDEITAGVDRKQKQAGGAIDLP